MCLWPNRVGKDLHDGWNTWKPRNYAFSSLRNSDWNQWEIEKKYFGFEILALCHCLGDLLRKSDWYDWMIKSCLKIKDKNFWTIFWNFWIVWRNHKWSKVKMSNCLNESEWRVFLKPCNFNNQSICYEGRN